MKKLCVRAAQWCSYRPTAAYFTASLLCVLLLYGRAITGGFSSYDDIPQIVQTPSLSSLTGSLKYFRSTVSFTSDLRGNGESFYRPLFWLSLAIDEKLWGLNPAAFHFTNVLLHWLSALSLFLLLRQFDISLLPSALTSLLWICLPVNSEAVAWISGRPYCLAAVFMLLGMLLAERYLCASTTKYLIGYCLAALCAMFSHEEGVLIVAFTLLLVFAKRRGRSQAVITLNCISLLSILIYFASRQTAGATVVRAKGSIAFLGLLFWKYISWMVLPIHMSIERSTDTPSPESSGLALAACLSLALVCAVLIASHRKLPSLSIAAAWIGIGLLPFCGVLFIYQGMAERYTYIASVGLSLMVVLIGMNSHVRLQPLIVGFLGVWILWSIYRLETRISDWSDAARLYRHSLLATPHSAKLHYDLGAVFEERKDFAQASGEYRKAIALEPQYVAAFAGLGNVDLDLGAEKEASQMFQKALQLKPDDVKAVTNFGTALQLLGNTNAAKAQYQRAIALAPQRDDAYCDLGVLLLHAGDTEHAILQFLQAAKINPDDPIPLFNLAAIYQRSGRRDLAIKLYTRVLQLDPSDADAGAALRSLVDPK